MNVMQRYMQLLLDVWREACRHIAIEESADSIVAILRRQIPVERLIIRRIDVGRACLDTVGRGQRDPNGPPPQEPVHTPCTPAQLEELLAWVRRGQPCLCGRKEQCPRREVLTPQSPPGDIMAGPLSGAQDVLGVVVMMAEPDTRFEQVHLEVLGELLDPLSVALANDWGLREIRTHREAAEADRQSLLARLGRREISDAIVGADSGLRSVMERVEQVARANVPVLIFGETGSGKEVIARAVHVRSERRGGPFLRVNCGAIPPELVDSELFGHERGSFTGAVGTRKGWFERADGGTLFLDEIGELPLAAQVRMLRVIQDGTFERVGGQRPQQVDVRIVAATHRDLQAMAAAGRFREDLWYRLAVFPIHLPPLRERPEDMAELAAHFATRASLRFGLPALAPTLEDIDLLSRYSWPGNIRELAAVIDRAAILGNGERLEIAKALGSAPESPGRSDAAPAWGSAPPAGGHNGSGNGDGTAGAAGGVGAANGVAAGGRPFEDLDTAMRRHIEAALARTHGRVEGRLGAARLLGINPHTLRARMRKLGIDWASYRPVAIDD